MFLQMPSLIRRLRQGPLGPAEKHVLQEIHSGQSRKAAPHVAGILVAVGRQELTRTSSPGRTAGQTIDRQLTGRRRAWRSRPISFDVSNFGRNSESRSPHRPKNLRGRHAFGPKSFARRNFQEGCDVHTLTGFRSGIGLLTALMCEGTEWRVVANDHCFPLGAMSRVSKPAFPVPGKPHPVTGQEEAREESRNGLKQPGATPHALSQLAVS